jgi:lycopene cyclase domain-containing protein
MRFEYLLTLLILFIIALFIKNKYQIKLFNNTEELLVFYSVIFVIGTIWDNFSVWRGHWFYPGKGIVGIFVGLIPLEDYVFAIVTSFTVLVLYRSLPKILKQTRN